MADVMGLELNGEQIGLLVVDRHDRRRGLRFYSGIAPYNRFDGAFFLSRRDATAVLRSTASRASAHVGASLSTVRGHTS